MRQLRARVREIPDGVYEAESFMDDDGIKLGERVPIRVRVEIAGDRMKVDLTDVAKQVAGSTIPARPRAAPAARWHSSA